MSFSISVSRSSASARAWPARAPAAQRSRHRSRPARRPRSTDRQPRRCRPRPPMTRAPRHDCDQPLPPAASRIGRLFGDRLHILVGMPAPSEMRRLRGATALRPVGRRFVMASRLGLRAAAACSSTRSASLTNGMPCFGFGGRRRPARPAHARGRQRELPGLGGLAGERRQARGLDAGIGRPRAAGFGRGGLARTVRSASPRRAARSRSSRRRLRPRASSASPPRAGRGSGRRAGRAGGGGARRCRARSSPAPLAVLAAVRRLGCGLVSARDAAAARRAAARARSSRAAGGGGAGAGGRVPRRLSGSPAASAASARGGAASIVSASSVSSASSSSSSISVGAWIERGSGGASPAP